MTKPTRLLSVCLALVGPAAAGAADLGLPATYLCGDYTVNIAAGPDEARLRLGGRWSTFLPAVAASGAKYEAEGAPDHWVWSKGEAFSVGLAETGEVTCRRIAEAPESLAAGGFEPGWRLILQDGKAGLSLQDGTAVTADHAAPQAIPGGRRIAFGAATADIADTICRDAATGMPHPHSVTVTGADRSFQGCGGDPRDLLTGLTWKIASIGQAPVAEGVEADIRFEGDGTFSGASGCNRMRGSYELSGEGLSIGPAATTMMACPEPQMQTERAVTRALAKVTRFDFAEDGGLILLSGDTAVLEARP